MPLVVSVVGCAATLCIVVISAIMNWHYGVSRGVTETDRMVLGALSIAIDAYKAIGLLVIAWALRHRRWFAASLGSVAWILSLAIGFVSAIGFVATTRDGTSSAAEFEQIAQRGLVADLKRKELRRETLGAAASLPVATQKHNALIADPLYAISQSCTNLRRRDVTRHCAQVRDAARDVELAREAATLDRDIANQREQLATVALGKGSGDAQSDALARLLGYDVRNVGIGISLLLALAAEFFSCCGLYLSLSHRASVNDDTAAEAATGDITRFARERTCDAIGATTDIRVFFAEYCAWCESTNAISANFGEFQPRWAELCEAVGWSITNNAVVDVAISDDTPPPESLSNLGFEQHSEGASKSATRLPSHSYAN